MSNNLPEGFKTTIANHSMILQSEEAKEIMKGLDEYVEIMWGDKEGEMIVSTDRTREHTVESFNRKDYFHKLLATIAIAENFPKFLPQRFGKDWREKHGVILGACCMQLGVAIKKEDMGAVRYALYVIEVDRPARRQMETAMSEYKSNGDMWDFDRSEPSNVFLLAHISSMLTATQCRTIPQPEQLSSC